MSATAAYLLRARLLADPPLWCWELTDRQGMLVRSSWHAEWAAYPTAAEALRAGADARKRWAKASGRRGPSPVTKSSAPRPSSA